MELKPCPFCGGEAKILQSGMNSFTISCKSCPARMEQKCLKFGMDWLENKMVELWNFRV